MDGKKVHRYYIISRTNNFIGRLAYLLFPQLPQKLQNLTLADRDGTFGKTHRTHSTRGARIQRGGAEAYRSC